MGECKINKYLTVKLVKKEIFIFINEEKYLHYSPIFDTLISSFDKISFNNAVKKHERKQANTKYKSNIPSTEKELQEICSYLKRWFENGYNTRLLNEKIAFPLLKKLLEVGDPKAKEAFSKEIIKTFGTSNYLAINFLLESNYFNELNDEIQKDLLIQEINNGNLSVILYLLNQNNKEFINKEDLKDTLSNPNSKIRVNLKNSLDDELTAIKVAFPLLKNIIEKGIFDLSNVLKSEIIKKLRGECLSIIKFLILFGYLKYLTPQEFKVLFLKDNLYLKNQLVESLKEKIESNWWSTNLIQQLCKNGDPTAKNIYWEAITKKLENENSRELGVLWKFNYLNCFTDEDLEILFKNLKIKEIDLTGTKDRSERFLKDIFNVKSLQVLNMGSAQIKRIPESISNLTSLVVLNLNFSKLETLPKELKYLNSLKTLNLATNNLKALPEWIGELNSLEELNLRMNKLVSLPESIGNLTSLISLNIAKNQLTYLPNSLGKLKSLRKLKMGFNKLENLPEWIGTLPKLQKLDLEGNNLKKLPDDIKNLISLEILNLKRNHLDKLPEWIDHLNSLTELYIQNNNLKILPESMLNLSSLKILGFHDNFDKKHLDAKSREIIAHLRRIGVLHEIFY